MAVRNPAKKNGRLTPYTENQTPSTERGQRRSEETSEYLQNLKTRQQQSYPSRRGGIHGPGPFKGPSKRPSGTDQKAWVEHMTGRRTLSGL